MLAPTENMKRISSKWTFFFKRIFPFLWFGLLSVVFVTAIFAVKAGSRAPLPALLGSLALMIFGYFLMKHLVFDLLDEVYDNGNSLLVKNRGQEDLIEFTDVMNVSYSPMINPPRITLALKKSSRFGTEITFSAPVSFVPFKKHPIAVDLIKRIVEAKRS